MTSRARDIEALQAAARAQIPSAALAQFAPLREQLEQLTRAAADPAVTDAQLLAMAGDLRRRLPALLRTLDPSPVATALEHASATALINGVAEAARPLLP